MDKNRIAGKAKQLKGTVKEVVGKVTGDRSTELKGKGEKIAGKVQEGYGKAKDELRASNEQARELKDRRR
ncbi:MAG: CsbD family protein [Phycisphaerae bacterium]|nr:CsbD family protein [Phycisphaerae bacterium]